VHVSRTCFRNGRQSGRAPGSPGEHPAGTHSVAPRARHGDRGRRAGVSGSASQADLLDGVLVEKAMGFRESRLAIVIAGLLDIFVIARNLGLVVGPDGMSRLWPGRLRAPDVAFFSWDRLPGRRMPREPIPTLAPNLAVEILSRSNTRGDASETPGLLQHGRPACLGG